MNTGRKELPHARVEQETSSEEEQRIKKIKSQLRDAKYFSQLKPDKRFIVDRLIYPGTNNMVSSPPGHFKTILSLYQALAVANGKDFFGLKTKKTPVLIIDNENTQETTRDRLKRIRKGQGWTKLRGLYWMFMKAGNLDDKIFFSAVQEVVKEKKIGLIIVDTIRRAVGFDENKATEVSKFFNEVFTPLTTSHDCAILFLHHANKDGIYRGSSDFQGYVDVHYTIIRRKEPNQFIMENKKNRRGEIDKIYGEIDFGSDYIKFNVLSEKVQAEEKNLKDQKKKEVSDAIKGLFSSFGQELKRKQIQDKLQEQHPDYSFSTIKRSLEYLVNNNYLKTDGKGSYTWIWAKDDEKLKNWG